MAGDQESDLVTEAIKGTEAEIFGEAFDAEDAVQEEAGDRSLESLGEGLEGRGDDDDADAEEEADEAATDADGKAVVRDPETGKFAAKDAKGEKPKAAEEDEEAEAEPPVKGKGEAEEPKGRVPAGRLREEAEGRRAAEDRAKAAEQQLEQERANNRTALEQLNAKLEGVLAAVKPGKPAQEAVKPEKPDMFADPEGYERYMQEQFDQRITQVQNNFAVTRVNDSLAAAAEQHGENFTKAHSALSGLDPQSPSDRATVQRIWNASNPGKALMTWHQQQETLREVGGDAGKYREKVEQDVRAKLAADPEFRKQLLADLRAEADNGDGKPRNVNRLPKSLNGMSGRSASPGGSQDNSDRAVFEEAFTD